MKVGKRKYWMVSGAMMALATLSACGGGGTSGGGTTIGGVASTPTPAPALAPAPASPPPSGSSFNTAEYQRSNAAVQANAISAYEKGATGTGITVAIVDGGIALNDPEFAGRIHQSSADVLGTRSIQDEGGHGTSVAAVLAAAKNDNNIQGVAYGATLLIARTDSPGSCADASADGGCSHDDNNIARGVDLAVNNGARVINISLGGSPANSNLRAAIDRATSRGVVIVFSAGNEFDTDPVNAANPDPLAQIATEAIARRSIIIAGALDASNTQLASFSNRAGSAGDVYLGALGSRVVSFDEKGVAWRYNGTSYAAPVVTGAIALLAQAYPNLTGPQLVDLVLRTALDLGDPGVDATFGRGALDITRAFQPQGQSALAGSAIPMALTTEGGLSPAMGDATPSGLSATILDDYGRAFDVNPGAYIGRARVSPRLFNALDTNRQGVGMGLGPASLAFSIRQSGAQARVERTLLAPHTRVQAQALAGHMLSHLDRNTTLAFGIATASRSLKTDLLRSNSDRFLMAGHSDGGWGFDANPATALMVARKIAGLTFFGGGETGHVRRWDANPNTGLWRDGQRYRFSSGTTGVQWQQDRVSLTASATVLNEAETVLGARFAAWLGSPGARTLFADAAVQMQASARVRFGASLRRGWTHVAAGGARDSGDSLSSLAWSADVEASGVLRANDRLGLRLSQPLRVSRGGFSLLLPTSYDYASGATGFSRQTLALAPRGRELDIEASWSVPLASGSLSSNLYWRKDPGHIRALGEDVGGAVRMRWDF